MANRNFEDPRWMITGKFAQWTVHSALRNPGSPIKRQAIIYDALYVVPFHELFGRDLGPIGEDEFAGWHTGAVDVLQAFELRLSVGWAAKMIAIYLKTTCYLAGYGRDGLDQVIHPPLDDILMVNLRREFRYHPEIAASLNRFRGW